MKKATVVLAALGLVVLTAAVAQAEICYQLLPFNDVLRLSVESDDGPPGASHHLAYGNWIASGFYTLPLVGARELDVGSTTTRRLGLHGTNSNGAFFGGNPICALDGIPGGAWFAVCTAGLGDRFVVSGNLLAAIPCEALAPSTAQPEGGVPAGAQ